MILIVHIYYVGAMHTCITRSKAYTTQIN